ncbi:hypothetical protein ACFWIW_31150 [Amycolatopsis sp. NPDC058340]|uniref:hypothetical protein n=1 Tax=Amycolatopsis sp. NPDC058340 TaxID=3346453 RepID=UPI003663BEF6
MKSLVLIAAAVGGLAFPGTAAAATSFEVCSPLGCAVQSVRGTVDRGHLVAKVSDSSPVSALTVWFTESPVGRRLQVVVDDGVRWLDAGLSTGATHLTVRACGGGGCNSKTIPL